MCQAINTSRYCEISPFRRKNIDIPSPTPPFEKGRGLVADTACSVVVLMKLSGARMLHSSTHGGEVSRDVGDTGGETEEANIAYAIQNSSSPLQGSTIQNSKLREVRIEGAGEGY